MSGHCVPKGAKTSRDIHAFWPHMNFHIEPRPHRKGMFWPVIDFHTQPKSPLHFQAFRWKPPSQINIHLFSPTPRNEVYESSGSRIQARTKDSRQSFSRLPSAFHLVPLTFRIRRGGEHNPAEIGTDGRFPTASTELANGLHSSQGWESDFHGPPCQKALREKNTPCRKNFLDL